MVIAAFHDVVARETRNVTAGGHRVSKYGILPSSTLAGVAGLSDGAGATSGKGCQGPAATAGTAVVNAIRKQTVILRRERLIIRLRVMSNM
jgi:hypothetical protein